MPAVLPDILIAAALIAAALLVIPLVRGRRIGAPMLVLFALIEVGLLVLLVLGIVNVANTDHPVDGTTFIAYLAASLVVIPGTMLWARAEDSRWGNVVLMAGLLVLAVLVVRLNQIWTAAHA